MAVIKCSNCGAQIPDKAAFCPECGTPKRAVSRATQPMRVMPSSIGNSSPLEGLFNMVFSKTAIIIGASIGILLVWIGVLIVTFAPLSSDVALLISSIGFAGIGLLLVCGGIWNKKIDKFARLGMVVIGAYVIVQTMSIVGFFNLFSGIT